MKSFKGLKTMFKKVGNDPQKDKYFELSVNANNWRKTSFSLIIVNLVLVFILGKITLTNKTQTYIIERTGTGNYNILGNVNNLVEKQQKASDKEIIYFINQVIEGTKFLPKDTEIYNRNYRKALNFLSRSASKKFDTYLKQEKYVEKVQGGKTVELAFNTGDKVSDKTYQIRWKQTTYNKDGSIEEIKNYSALVTIDFINIEPNKLYINPLGLMITDFSQKEEML